MELKSDLHQLKLNFILFPEDLKTEKYKNCRGKSSGGDRGRPKAARGHRRTTSHDNSYTSPFSGPRGKEKEKERRKASNRKQNQFFP